MNGLGGSPPLSLAELLLEKAAPEILRSNAFRITGLTAGATPRDIARQVKLLQMKAKLEGFASIGSGTIPMEPPPDSEAIRTAAHTLQDTEQRFLHEILWVWPEERQPGENLKLWPKLDLGPDGPGTVALHNQAVLAAVRAVDLEFADANSGPLPEPERQRLWALWKESASGWIAVLNDEIFWQLIEERGHDLDDPRLVPSAIRELRSALPQCFARIHAIQAFRSGQRQGQGIAGQHAMWTRRFAPQSADGILLDTSKPLREKITAICSRLEANSDRSVREIPQTVKSFLAEVAPLLATVIAVLGAKNVVASNLCDTVAEAASSSLVKYCNECGDFDTTAELLEQVRPIARSAALAERIARDLETARRNSWNGLYIDPLAKKLDEIAQADLTAAEKFSRIKSEVLPVFKRLQDARGEEEPVPLASRMVAVALRSISVELHNDGRSYELALDAIKLAVTICLDDELVQKLESERKTADQHAFEHRLTKDLEPIDSAPSLYTIDGWGTTMYGASDGESRTGSYLTTRYFTAFFLPLFPLSRYRVRRVADGQYQFLGKAPFRVMDKVHLGAFVAAVLIFFVSISTTSNTGAPSTMSGAGTTSAPSGYSSFTPDTAQPPVATESAPEPPRPVPATPTPSVPSTGAPGTRIVDLDSRAWEVVPDNTRQLKQELDDGRARLAEMKSELEAVHKEMASIKADLEAKKSALNSLESQMRLGMEVDEVRYKRSIREYNDLVSRYNSLREDELEKARQHDALVDEFNEKVRRYNRGARR